MRLPPVPTRPWIDSARHAEVVQALLEFGLLKSSNARDLPLKSGGKTDIYINLRDARRCPESIDFVSDLFRDPLHALRVGSFIEVPDSVSCFAGPLSIASGLPYATIREVEKGGRVSDARLIGRLQKGDLTAIFDDVVTDGESKIVPVQFAEELGAIVRALVVLVDRQQGWKEKFAERGVKPPVWAGMTLHDVRRELILSGAMQRCKPDMEEKNPIIVALDGKSWDEILPIIDPLRTTGMILKVNDLLFAEGFNHLLRELGVYGRIMVDLKGHDIPETLKNIAKRLAPHNPWGVTVHASGHKEMITGAVNILREAGCTTKVLAVTVLTSMKPGVCEDVYVRRPLEQVLELARIAHEAGAHGFVCSPLEVGELRSRYPDKLLVTPGVRSPGADVGDQARVDTPKAAIDRGANHVVMGRQVLGAPDRAAEVHRVLTDELGISMVT